MNQNNWASADQAAGPYQLAEQNDRALVLHQTIVQLDERERWLCEGRLAGMPVASIAKRLHISCFATKRLWRKIRIKLGKSLAQCRG